MRIKIEGMEEFRKDIDSAVSDFPNVVKRAMEGSTQFIKNKVQDKITSEKIPFTGELQRSIYARVDNPFRGKVFVGAKHGIFVERGTRPHWPPIDPIERWASVKLGSPGAGFVIARSISKKGTKAHPYFEPAVNESIDGVFRIFTKTIETLVRKMT